MVTKQSTNLTYFLPASSIFLKIKPFPGGEVLGNIKLALISSVPCLHLNTKRLNSVWDNTAKSELKVQTSNNSHFVVCVSGKPQRALVYGPAHIATSCTYQFDLINLGKQKL